VRNKVPISDIKAKLNSTLNSFVKEGTISSFTQLELKNVNSRQVYQTTITTNNITTNITMSKDGTTAHLSGSGFNAAKYKLLVDTFIRTNEITSLDSIDPININDENLTTAKDIIRNCIEAYKQELDNPGLEVSNTPNPQV
jgi:hypothetical protein